MENLTKRLELILMKWGAWIIDQVEASRAAALAAGGNTPGGRAAIQETVREAAREAARDLVSRAVTSVVTALIVTRARKSQVGAVASRLARAQLVHGYPVSMYHLCVADL